MDNPLFTGVCTALVTPFINDRVNYPMLELLLNRQISAGIPAVIIAGTTGEGATLTDKEKLELFRISKDIVGDKMKIIAGTGSNSTQHAVELSGYAQEAGVDGLLVVSPYYNKATPDGLFAHYLTISNSVNLPIVIYNVPSRTGLDIPVSVYRQLAKIPNIAGVKEASDSIEKVVQIKSECPDSFAIWTGNDAMTVPVISLGGSGVISVTSNVIPVAMVKMTEDALNGDFILAGKLQAKLYPLIKQLFCEVNPIPVKAGMKLIGYDCGPCRLPLTTLSNAHLAELRSRLI